MERWNDGTMKRRNDGTVWCGVPPYRPGRRGLVKGTAGVGAAGGGGGTAGRCGVEGGTAGWCDERRGLMGGTGLEPVTSGM